jgi:O-antigen/teichoic acid export membrane protein
LFSFGSKLLVAGLLNTIYDNLNPIVIGKFFSAQDLGYYNRGTHFASFPSQNINGVLQRVSFPVMAKIQDDTERLISVYRKNIGISCLGIFFCCIFLASIGKPLVLLLLGEKWADSILYLQIYCFAILFNHINVINLNLLQIKGRSDLFLRLEVIKKVISIIILFGSIPFGVLGICCSKIIYTQIAVFINTYYTGKLFNLGYFAQIRDFYPYFVFSLFACLPTFLISFLALPNLLIILVGAFMSVLLYIAFLRKDDNMRELLQLVLKKNKTK